MRLRNISPPYDQIEKEQLQMRNEMISMGPGNEEVRKRIAAFLNEREEPQN
jgi:hypothetical protein